MAVQAITYQNKQFLNENSSIANINKVCDTDMNEIKDVVNNNASITQQNQTAINSMQNGNAYLTSEVTTGMTWIDNKPIYRKVIDCGALPNATTKSVAHNVSNIDTVVFANGVSYSTTTGFNFPIPYAADTLQAQVKMWVTSTDIYLQTIANRSEYNQTYIIIEYTKTTD